MIFCQSQGVIFNHLTNKTGLHKMYLQTIFKKFAINGMRMDFEAFRKCINFLAIKYYEKRDVKVLSPTTFWEPPKYLVDSKDKYLKKVKKNH